MSNLTLKNFAAAADLKAYQETLTGPSWLADLRKRARKRFAAADWPTTSEEEWRRTPLRAFDFDAYRVGGEDGCAPEGSPPAPGDGLSARLRVENGRVTSARVADTAAGAGVLCGSLEEVSGKDERVGRLARAAVEQSFDRADNRLEYWQYATLVDVAVVYVPRFVELDRPVLVDVHAGGDEVLRTPRVAVILDEGARATVIKRVSSPDEGEVLLVDGDDLVVGASAGLTVVTIQRMNEESLCFTNSRGSVSRDGQLRRTEVALGADFVKSRFVSELAGPGADAVLNGIYFGTSEQHLDLRTVQRHLAPRTTSRAFYKGAVRAESHSIYQGLIQVDGAAPGTDAYLTNNNLILSEDARADSIPSLNISTDDVRCSHGSTTGKLDQSQIFYLRTRGYTEEEARLMLIEGFFEGLIAQCPEQVRDEIRALVADRAGSDDE